MRYLLDTNIVSALVRDPNGPLHERVRQEGESAICTSVIVAAEMRYGAVRRGSARLTQQLERVLVGLEILPFEAPADAIYGDLRARLEQMGQPIGAIDFFIAAHTLALGYTLVTDNEREFRRIPELPVENWLR